MKSPEKQALFYNSIQFSKSLLSINKAFNAYFSGRTT